MAPRLWKRSLSASRLALRTSVRVSIVSESRCECIILSQFRECLGRNAANKSSRKQPLCFLSEQTAGGFHFLARRSRKFRVRAVLGSSATIRLGVLQGLNQITGGPLDQLSIFRLCAELEGHPDNAAPASFGGFTVARSEDVQCFDVSPRLKFVLLIPDFEIQTAAARAILPEEILHMRAVENVRNACAITAAFASRDYGKLRGAFEDELHQPFRVKAIRFLPCVIAAAEKAGALGAFLSGSGSTICAVTLGDPKKIAVAIQQAARTRSQIIITAADNRGVQIYR